MDASTGFQFTLADDCITVTCLTGPDGRTTEVSANDGDADDYLPSGVTFDDLLDKTEEEVWALLGMQERNDVVAGATEDAVDVMDLAFDLLRWRLYRLMPCSLSKDERLVLDAVVNHVLFDEHKRFLISALAASTGLTERRVLRVVRDLSTFTDVLTVHCQIMIGNDRHPLRKDGVKSVEVNVKGEWRTQMVAEVHRRLMALIQGRGDTAQTIEVA
jgi:hypothetical protein